MFDRTFTRVFKCVSIFQHNLPAKTLYIPKLLHIKLSNYFKAAHGTFSRRQWCMIIFLVDIRKCGSPFYRVAICFTTLLGLIWSNRSIPVKAEQYNHNINWTSCFDSCSVLYKRMELLSQPLSDQLVLGESHIIKPTPLDPQCGLEPARDW